MAVAKVAKETAADTRVNRVSPFAENVLNLSMSPLLDMLGARYKGQGEMIFSVVADRLRAAHNFSDYATITPGTSRVAEIRSIHGRRTEQEGTATVENLEVAFYEENYPTGIVTAFSQRRGDRPRVEETIRRVITITPYNESIDVSENDAKQGRAYDDRLAFVELRNGDMRIVRPFREPEGRLTYIAIPAPQEGSPEYQMLQALSERRSGHTESNLEEYLRELALPIAA